MSDFEGKTDIEVLEDARAALQELRSRGDTRAGFLIAQIGGEDEDGTIRFTVHGDPKTMAESFKQLVDQDPNLSNIILTGLLAGFLKTTAGAQAVGGAAFTAFNWTEDN